MKPETALNFDPDRVLPCSSRESRAWMRENRSPTFIGGRVRPEPGAKPVPRPAWMDDPSLLPKRPPGRAA